MPDFKSFFKRGRGDLTDAQAYLRSTDSVSRRTAIILGVTGFLVVFASVFALFLGGQWIYSRLSGDSPEQVSTVDTTGADQTPATLGDILSEEAPAQTDDQATQTSPTAPSTTVTSSATTSSTSEDLPNTGPADTAALVVLVTILGTVAHRTYATKKLS